MRILFIPVNYNSYNELDCYIKSIQVALRDRLHTEVNICVADNSTIKQSVDINADPLLQIQVKKYPNLGYFGAALDIYNSYACKDSFDYIIISNVDVTVGSDFFKQLETITLPKCIGWIAPMIWSKAEQRDKNPKIQSRYSLHKLNLIKNMWRFPLMHKLYETTLYKRKKIRASIERKFIYAGHGSFIILTKDFVTRIPHLNYPIFLFGEEIFLAEMCRQKKLKVLYDPSIIVYDEEHVSTGQMKSSFYYKCNKEAISYIIKTFYE